MRVKLDEEINKALQEHLEFIEKMRLEHIALVQAHKNKCENMKSEYKEIEKLFSDRPSRPDDIRHIKFLMKEVDAMKKNLADAEVKVMHANGKQKIT